jgi:predicted amidohydrolase YtcJ
MAGTLFANVRIIDGSGAEPFTGHVLVEGNRIESVGRERPAAASEAFVVDGSGATLMPGLVEAHAHISFANTCACRKLYPTVLMMKSAKNRPCGKLAVPLDRPTAWRILV